MAKSDQFTEKEARERFEAALRGALKTSAIPLKNKPKSQVKKKKKPPKRA